MTRGLILVSSVLLSWACGKREIELPPAPEPPVEIVLRTTTGVATWYDVPDGSLAARRAPKTHLTAAHHDFPIGNRVRVSREDDGRSVTVIITDRGMPSGHIDLSEEAAGKIGMVRAGRVKVRMELLAPEGR